MKFRLTKDYPTSSRWEIKRGRDKIGSVVQHADGDWVATIGNVSLRRPTRERAFDDVVADLLGFESGAALRQRNSMVRRAKAIVRRRADHAVYEYQRGNMKPLDTMLTSPQGAVEVLKSYVRDLKRG